MKFRTLLYTVISFVVFGQSAFAKIQTEIVEYKDGDAVLEGFLAYDDAIIDPRPGVLIIHDWTGVSDYVKGRAQELARLGYVAFCADIYGKGIRPTDMKECAVQAGKYKEDILLFRRRTQAGLEQLANHKLVEKSKIAAIGYCFGGTSALELGRSGAEIAGIVSFHGGLSTSIPEDAKNIKARVLICHGADDPFVKPDEVAAFKDEMTKAKVDYKFIAYPGVVHSFTRKDAGEDKSKGVAYDAAADKESWQAMKDFFAEIFKS